MNNEETVPASQKQKRGRPHGGKNQKGNNAGRKRQQIANQSLLNTFFTVPEDPEVNKNSL